MAIISFDKDAIIDYVPEYGGNRESDNPCVVRLRPVPYSRVQEYSRLLAARSTAAKGDATKMSDTVQALQKKQFTENVESVSGYFVGEREVTDPECFYKTADTDLVIEILRAMESMSKLSEGQRKNS